MDRVDAGIDDQGIYIGIEAIQKDWGVRVAAIAMATLLPFSQSNFEKIVHICPDTTASPASAMVAISSSKLLPIRTTVIP